MQLCSRYKKKSHLTKSLVFFQRTNNVRNIKIMKFWTKNKKYLSKEINANSLDLTTTND